MFEASGDLLTSGLVRRAAVAGSARRRTGVSSASVRRRRLPLPASESSRSPRTGRVGSWPWHTARLRPRLTPERAFQVGPLDDVKAVAVSPDGECLATGCHGTARYPGLAAPRRREVADLQLERFVGVDFSPDGKWLMTENPPCRLWEVGTWREARQIGRPGSLLFSRRPPGGGHGLEQGPAAGRGRDGPHARAARKPRPGRRGAVTFSPDGSRLVVTTNDGPAVHVWDLRAIRRKPRRDGPRLGRTAPIPKQIPPTENTAAAPLQVVADLGVSGAKCNRFSAGRQFEQEGKIAEAIGRASRGGHGGRPIG